MNYRPKGESRMPNPVARDVLDREFLTMRCHLLDLAAAIDRVSRADDQATDDPRWRQLQQAIGVIASPDGNRAEQVQMTLSLPYDGNWRHEYGGV
jgi:hypothetical protein